MESRYRDSDRQIYVNSVFWYILLFWKRIIAVTVIMAVVVMGFGSVTAYLKEKKAIKDAPVVDYEAMAKDETVIRALSVKKQYDEFEKNYYNDYVNNIDSSNVSKVTIQYNISGASNIDDLMENYKIFVAGEEVRKAIIEKTGDTFRESDLDVLVSSSSGGNTLSVTIKAKDKEMCDTLAGCIKEKIAARSEVMQGTVVKHYIKINNESYNVGFDQEISNFQISLKNTFSNETDKYRTMINKLTEDQKVYVNADGNITNNTEKVTLSIKSFVKTRNAVIDAVIGLFLAVVFFALRFILSKKLRNTDDIRNLGNMNLIGTVSDLDTRKMLALDKAIYKKCYKVYKKEPLEKQIQYVAKNIYYLCKHKDINSIFITSSLSDNVKAFDMLAESLKSNGLEIVSGKDILTDVKSLENAINSEAVIFFEKIGRSDYNDLCDNLDLCEQQGINVLGTVMIM